MHYNDSTYYTHVRGNVWENKNKNTLPWITVIDVEFVLDF